MEQATARKKTNRIFPLLGAVFGLLGVVAGATPSRPRRATN